MANEFDDNGNPKGYKLHLSKEQIDKMFNTSEYKKYKQKKVKNQRFKERMYKITSLGGAQVGVKWLIITNVIVFILNGIGLLGNLAIFPIYSERFAWWQLLTNMFAHMGLLHIGLNMLMLWMFGKDLEDFWGTKKFILFYILAGLGAGIFCTFLSFNPCLGASGAIFGLMTAYAFIYPENTVLVFFLIPMKIKTMVIILGAISLVFGLLSLVSPSMSGGVAHIGHLGGMVFGGLLAYYWKRSGKLENATL